MKPATAIVALAAIFSLACPPSVDAANDDPDARILRAERWLKATLSHQPGLKDDAVTEVSLWTDVQLRALFVDQQAIAELILNPDKKTFKAVTIGGRQAAGAYTNYQVHRIKVLACAASGDLHTEACSKILADREIDSTLVLLAKAAARETDFVTRHGALLHTDIAMFGPEPLRAPDTPFSFDGKIRVQLSDGESSGINAAPIHWEMARQLLDYVKPPGDAFVRRWYAVTAMWMQDRQQHDTAHLKHARALFPDDADILFLSGCQQETYASPAIQSVVRTAVLPTGFSLDVASEGTALRDAEEYFRRALARDPGRRDARIHLGHVLLARGRAPEAADLLRPVDTADLPSYSR